MAVTWNYITGAVLIYADGKEIGRRIYTPVEEFYGPTGNQSAIGNDGHTDSHQFYGSVMDLYVFGWALSSVEISALRGKRLPDTLRKNVCVCGESGWGRDYNSVNELNTAAGSARFQNSGKKSGPERYISSRFSIDCY